MKLDWLTNIENGVAYLTPPNQDFEELYIQVRETENRVHSDEFVKTLPNVLQTHPHFNEWNKRNWTLQKFKQYLDKENSTSILEIGCGNGWFSNAIATKNRQVFGLDVGKTELEQASRCFAADNIHFLCCTNLEILPENTFDFIVFNASIQYFDLSDSFWKMILQKIKGNGEIHILDSPFYSENEREEAKKRTRSYFNSIDCDEAENYYKHLLWNELPSNSEIICKPNKIRNKLNKNRSPFPWIKIKK